MKKNEQIEELLTRGVECIYPSKEALEVRLTNEKPLRMYLGIDPTGPSLHIGHAVNLLKLKEFQDLGHDIILLIGDFTAMIGDPTDKAAARKKLSQEEVLENCKNYLDQAGKILDISKVEVRYNSSWLSKLTFAEILELSSQITFAQLVKRDMFQKRLADNKDLFLHEFLYPLMQGYDSVALNVDMEIGGNDQMFNMLIGRDLMKSLKHKDKFVLTSKLLVDPTGKKMGKSEGNMVTIADTPKDMFGKVMSWPDSMMERAFEICTRVPTEAYKKILESNPLEAKLALAHSITKIYHGASGADEGRGYFEKTIQNKEIPQDIKEVSVNVGAILSETLCKEKIIKSKSEYTRLVKEGGVSVNGEKLHDPLYTILETITVKIGKLRYLKIAVQ